MHCNGPSRREVLNVGAVGLLGLSLADVLRAEAAAGLGRGRRNVILVWLHGGQTQLDTYDMKPEAPSEVRGPFRPIETTVPGLQICELLPRLARVMHCVTVHRGFHHQNNDHFAAAHWLLTGHLGATGADQHPRNPALGAVAARVLGPRQPGVPPYVVINDGGFGYHGAAYLGARHHPIRTGDESYGDEGPRLPVVRVDDLRPAASLDGSRYGRREALLRRVDAYRRQVDATAGERELTASQAEALRLLTSSRAFEAFDLSRESAGVRDSYGPGWGEDALLARRLIEAGARFVVCNTGYWDDHGDIKGAMESKLPRHDRMLAALISDLADRGLLDDTLVIAAGEFGRTPQINAGGGRDHWAQASCLLLAGGGYRHGQVLGATDGKAAYPVDNAIGPADLQATLCHHLRLDRTLQFEDFTGRPQYLLPPDTGAPIRELL